MIEYLRKVESMKRLATTFVLVGFFVYVSVASAAMSSTNYNIRWDTFSTGGSDTSNSASYILRDTVAGTSGSASASSTYQVSDGYRSGVFDRVVSFDLYIQNSSNEREITGLSGTTVSMSSTSGLSVNDYVGVVQDRGASQVTGFGKIQSIGAGNIVLDRITTNGTTSSIDGTNDYLYQLNAGSLTLEPLTTSTVATGNVGFAVTIDNSSGYTIQVLDDGDLRSGTDTIDAVSDGSVTASSEEYGARSSDTTLSDSTFDTQDTALTTSTQEIVSKGSSSFEDRSFLTLKAAISTSTVAGTYGHTVTFIASGNF